jgi:hypothetical protein
MFCKDFAASPAILKANCSISRYRGLPGQRAACISALAVERSSAIPARRTGTSSSLSVRSDFTAARRNCSIERATGSNEARGRSGRRRLQARHRHVNMPRMDGLNCAHESARKDSLEHAQVVVRWTSTYQEDISRQLVLLRRRPLVYYVASRLDASGAIQRRADEASRATGRN